MASELSVGLAVALVGMLGTVLALTVLAVLIALLGRAFPPTENAQATRPRAESQG